MKTKYVISKNNIPRKLPVFAALTSYLALEHFNAPEWLYGAVGFLFLLIFIGAIHGIVVQEEVEIFPATEEEKKEESGFSARLRKAMKAQEDLNNS